MRFFLGGAVGSGTGTLAGREPVRWSTILQGVALDLPPTWVLTLYCTALAGTASRLAGADLLDQADPVAALAIGPEQSVPESYVPTSDSMANASPLFTWTLSQALAKLRAGVFSGEPGGGGSWMIRSIWLVR